MGLADFEPEITTIRFKANKKDHSFTVRGLNLEDMTLLLSAHMADIEAAVVLFKEAQRRAERVGNFDAFILEICGSAPKLVAEIISVAADEPELSDKYRKLSFSVQALALSEVVRLTLEEVGGLKNLQAVLASVAGKLFPTREEPLEPPPHETKSPDSIGEFEKA